MLTCLKFITNQNLKCTDINVDKRGAFAVQKCQI